MTKQDYIKISRAINLTYRDNNNIVYQDIFLNLINRIGIELKTDNPKFDHLKFTKECLK